YTTFYTFLTFRLVKYYSFFLHDALLILFLLVNGSIFESWTDIVWNGSYLFGLTFGITIGIPAAYIIYYTLINQGEASKVGSATFLVPIISVLIGVVFLDEALTITLLIGMTLVGISIYLVNFNEQKMKEKVVKKNSEYDI